MVYITSDLFGPATTHDREPNSLATSWPTMASSQHPAGLGKRKRHDGNDGPSMYEGFLGLVRNFNPDHISSKHQSPHWLPPSTRETTRPHNINALPYERNSNSNLSYAHFLSTPNNVTSERRPVKQMKRLSPKAALVKSTSHLMDVEVDPSPQSQHTAAQAPAVSDLRSCHACNLAPKRRKDLVNYLDCRRCDGRTCYICARQCVGGCGKAICKKCIVEVGQEGESWCLDCYSRHINS